MKSRRSPLHTCVAHNWEGEGDLQFNIFFRTCLCNLYLIMAEICCSVLMYSVQIVVFALAIKTDVEKKFCLSLRNCRNYSANVTFSLDHPYCTSLKTVCWFRKQNKDEVSVLWFALCTLQNERSVNFVCCLYNERVLNFVNSV